MSSPTAFPQPARVAAVLVAAALVVGGVATATWYVRRPPPPPPAVTFSHDIAPLVFAKCAPCHRPDGAAPFSLLDFDDVASRAAEIRDVTKKRFMPPWRPAPGYVKYANDRSLTDDEIALLARWIDEGKRPGDPRETPPPPVMSGEWQLGKPDAIVPMGAPWELAADGNDVYRNFVLPAPVTRSRFVKAWEFSPGTRVIHHAIVNLDRYGLARRKDEQDPGPGFAGMDPGDAQSADGFYLVWTPGKFPLPPDPNSAFRVDGHTDLVLQLHMQPSGKPETVSPKIGLYFTDKPPEKPRFALRVGDPPLDIPAGEANYVTKVHYVVPTAIDVLTVFPHAHYVATRVRSWATLPDGTEAPLLKIDDWDFAWQDEYTFATPVSLPAGTKIWLEFVYDNSSRNVRNPNNPPARVVSGERSVDEMGNVTFQVAPTTPQGMNALRESKYRQALAASDSARNRYNLANVLSDQGKKDEAIVHYRRAIEFQPSFALARDNLGMLLATAGQFDEAIQQFQAAAKAQPELVSAHVNLGNALSMTGKGDAALKAFRAAAAADGKNALALNSLALALAERGDHKGAIEQFRAAVAVEPNDWRSHFHLGEALRASGARDDAIVHLRRALALRPNAPEPRAALVALGAEP